jgi:type VI secretion system secreted protein VgrG
MATPEQNMQALKDLVADLQSQRQHNRILRLHFVNDDGPAAIMLCNGLNAYESLSRDFQFNVEVLSDDAGIELKTVQGKLVTVELVREDGSLRYFNGHVFEFRLDKTDGGVATYHMVLKPWTAYLRLRKNNRMFHGKTVLQQTRLIFGEYRINHWDTQVKSADPAMTDAVQFDESDHNYLHRRWEQLGWHYWYEHGKSGHQLILCCDSASAKPIDGPSPAVPWQAAAGSREDDAIATWAPVRYIMPGQYAATGFDFKAPRPVPGGANLAHVPTLNQQGDVLDLEVYEYAGAYAFKDAAEGDALVRRRMEEIEARGKHFEATGNDRYLQPGRYFSFTDHFEFKGQTVEAEFLITEARHQARNNYLQASGVLPFYANQLQCIRKKIPWRPGRGFTSTEPKIYGVQTATVVGPKGAEIHSDEYGRVRLQYHWDREGTFNQESSAWVRVASTWAGSNFGFMAVPRIGQEVLVQFLDGNPDRPIITGRVYNADNMPPWDLPANQTQTGILSRSSQGGAYDNANALRFEDKKGEEQLWLHAEKDQLTEVENDEKKWVGRDRVKDIDRDETSHIKRDRTETVDHDETITVHNNRTERVDHDEKVSIGDNRNEDVGIDENVKIGKHQSLDVGQNRSKSIGKNEKDKIGKNWSIKVGAFKTETIALAYMQNVGLAKMVNIGGVHSVNVGAMAIEMVGLSKMVKVSQSYSSTAGKDISFEAGKTYTVDAGDNNSHIKMDADSITLSVGKASITLKKSGEITIAGTKVETAGSEAVNHIGPNINNN